MPDLLYKIFLSTNFDSRHNYLYEYIKETAEKKNVEIIMAAPGTGAVSLPKKVLSMLKSVEGLLVVINEESHWIRNEIGMAFALNLPIYLIPDEKVNIDDISIFLTSYKTINISDRKQLEHSCQMAFSSLIEEINNRRGRYFEPMPIDKPVKTFSWDTILEMIQQAHRIIQMDTSFVQGGFKPTLMLGISRGGIIVADILSRLGGDIPLGLLEADRKSSYGQVTFKDEPLKSILKMQFSNLDGKEIRILVIDDITKTGTTLDSALNEIEKISNSLPKSKNTKILCKSLVLIKQDIPKKSKRIDYFLEKVPGNTAVVLPWGLG